MIHQVSKVKGGGGWLYRKASEEKKSKTKTGGAGEGENEELLRFVFLFPLCVSQVLRDG